MVVRGGVERGVSGVPRRGFGSAVAADVHGRGLDGVETQGGEPRDDFGGAEIGAGLQTVVDGHATGADAELGGLEGESGGERHGVGTAGAGDKHQGRGARGFWRRMGGAVVVEYVVEYAADRQAYRRDRRMGTHVRFPS